MDIKGYGNFQIQRGSGRVDSYDFINTISTGFIDAVKSGLQSGTTLQLQNNFKLRFAQGIDNNGSLTGEYTDLTNGGSSTAVINNAYQKITFTWSRGNEFVFADGTTNTGTTVGLNQVRLWGYYTHTSSQLQTIGTSSITELVMDWNDYFTSATYTVEFGVNSSASGYSLSPNAIAAALVGGESGKIKPSRLRFYKDSGFSNVLTPTGSSGSPPYIPVTYSNGSITQNGITFTDAADGNDNAPEYYRLFTYDGANEGDYASGTVTHNPPLEGAGSVAWLSGDELNFSYSTSAFS